MRVLSVLLLGVLILSCGQQQSKAPDMAGAYYMTSQLANFGSGDSALDRKQMKIYTDHYMMYAAPNLTDSFASFGIGTYKLDGGNLTEYVFYTAAGGNHLDTSVLSIEKRGNGYKQVINDILMNGRHTKLTEEYDTIGKVVTSALDGAWKQTKNIYINAKGDSSVNNNPIEYKTYQGGHFIWATTVKDSANQQTSVFGYGPFSMKGENKVLETIMNATYAKGLVGKTYEVDIEWMGKDSYKQTITFAKGEKSIEIYQRLN